MIIVEAIGVGIFWVMWWFASAFIGDQVAQDSSSNKRASSRFATVLATLPLIGLFAYRLAIEAPLIYGSSDAALIFLPYLGVLALIYHR